VDECANLIRGKAGTTARLELIVPEHQYWDALFHLSEAVKAALDRDGVTSPLPAFKVLQDSAPAPVGSL
jgi:hypothetical protein